MIMFLGVLFGNNNKFFHTRGNDENLMNNPANTNLSEKNENNILQEKDKILMPAIPIREEDLLEKEIVKYASINHIKNIIEDEEIDDDDGIINDKEFTKLNKGSLSPKSGIINDLKSNIIDLQTIKPKNDFDYSSFSEDALQVKEDLKVDLDKNSESDSQELLSFIPLVDIEDDDVNNYLFFAQNDFSNTNFDSIVLMEDNDAKFYVNNSIDSEFINQFENDDEDNLMSYIPLIDEDLQTIYSEIKNEANIKKDVPKSTYNEKTLMSKSLDTYKSEYLINLNLPHRKNEKFSMQTRSVDNKIIKFNFISEISEISELVEEYKDLLNNNNTLFKKNFLYDNTAYVEFTKYYEEYFNATQQKNIDTINPVAIDANDRPDEPIEYVI